MEELELNEHIDKVISKVIGDPLHGKELYTDEMIEDIKVFLKNFISVANKDNMTDLDKIENVNRFIKDTVNLNGDYFDAMKTGTKIDKSSLYRRTAHAALIGKSCICMGFAEASRLLLESLNVKTKTCLAVLVDSRKAKENGKNAYKDFFHYITLAEYKDSGESRTVVLDPERQANRERKKLDFSAYMDTVGIILDTPNEFISNKIGDNGLGCSVGEIQDLEVVPLKNVGKVLTNKTISKNVVMKNDSKFENEKDI